MAYSFDQIFAADPSNPSNVAQNAAVTIFAPGDSSMTPLTITDPDGQPLANPIPVNANGFGSAFAHATLDRVAWAGGGFTGFFTSYEGMKGEAVAARAAAETAAATAGTEAAAVATAAIGTATTDATAAAASAATAASNALASATAAANAAALVGAPADSAIAAAVNNGASATNAALSSTYAGAIKFDTAISKLDLKVNEPLVIAQCSDSTGYRSDQFFELGWKKCMADLWPERPARVQRWDVATNAYLPWESWQTGAQPNGTSAQDVFRDTFGVARNPLGGTSPELGGAYITDAGTEGMLVASGGRLVRSGASNGTRANARSLLAARPNSDFRVTGTIKIPAAPTGGAEADVMITRGGESDNRIKLTIAAGNVATLNVMYDNNAGTIATLGTFPTANVVYGVDMPFVISLTGTTVSAALNGAVVSNTLTQARADLFAGNTVYVSLRTGVIGTEYDDVHVTAQLPTYTVPDAPGVDFYNGGASGTTPSYHLARLAQMYPVAPDLLVMNHMHNFPDSMTNAECLAAIQAFVDALTDMHGEFGVIVNSQNPRFGAFAKPVHAGRIVALRDYARGKGWGYIASYEAFAELPDMGRSLLVDDLHPAIGPGRQLQADVFTDLLYGLSKRRTVKV